MKVSEMFPKRYATGEDLHGKSLIMTIAKINAEKMRPKANAPEVEKWVLYFKEAKKGVVLNRTLANQIAEILGSQETNDWINKKITLYSQEMQVGGRKLIVIRARAAQVKPINNSNLQDSLLGDLNDHRDN